VEPPKLPKARIESQPPIINWLPQGDFPHKYTNWSIQYMEDAKAEVGPLLDLEMDPTQVEKSLANIKTFDFEVVTRYAQRWVKTYEDERYETGYYIVVKWYTWQERSVSESVSKPG
jgi:hypothetical protein